MQIKELWITNVGSHVWQMNRPDSDIDLFIVYIVPTKDILSGRNHGMRSHNYKGDKIDKVSHEIGKVIEQVIKGNINFLTGVLSDIVVDQQDKYLDKLKYLTRKYGNTKACVNSIRGLAIHNYSKYIVNCNTEKKTQSLTKQCNTINRSLLFGINVLEGNGFKFTPVFNQTPDNVVGMLSKFDQAINYSTLPIKTDPEPFRDFLLELRLKELNGEM